MAIFKVGTSKADVSADSKLTNGSAGSGGVGGAGGVAPGGTGANGIAQPVYASS